MNNEIKLGDVPLRSFLENLKKAIDEDTKNHKKVSMTLVGLYNALVDSYEDLKKKK